MANGIMTNTELIDSLVMDLNESVKHVCAGDYISWCAVNVRIFQKLNKLKSGVANDLKNREKVIEELKQQIRAFGATVVDIPAEDLIKAGAENGSN